MLPNVLVQRRSSSKKATMKAAPCAASIGKTWGGTVAAGGGVALVFVGHPLRLMRLERQRRLVHRLDDSGALACWVSTASRRGPSLWSRSPSGHIEQDVGDHGLGLAFEVQVGHTLDHGTGRQLVVGVGPDQDAARGRLALEPGAEVDGVAEDALDAVATLTDDTDERLAAVDPDAERRPARPLCRYLGGGPLEGERGSNCADRVIGLVARLIEDGERSGRRRTGGLRRRTRRESAVPAGRSRQRACRAPRPSPAPRTG